MRRAGHQRPVSVRATTAAPSRPTLNIVGLADPPHAEAPLEVELLPSVQASNRIRSNEAEARDARYLALETAIRQRIESRLSGRVRNLHVRASAGTVVLEGECTTFYTKQLAQHTAMGILDDEQLENAIVVAVQ